MSDVVDAAAGRARRPRGSLSAEQIVAGARELIEKNGLDGLSMPALGRYLDAGVTSIYWYFRSKDDLVRTVVDEVADEVAAGLPAFGAADWDAALLDFFAALHRVLLDNAVAREVFVAHASALFAHPAIRQRFGQGVDLLMRTGLSEDDAVCGMRVCSNYTGGFVLIERSRRGADRNEFESGLRVLVNGLRHPMPDASATAGDDTAAQGTDSFWDEWT